jgi:pimeloyl-ACP methyl ester carboxylesterase
MSTAPAPATRCIALTIAGRHVDIEYAWLGAHDIPGAPLVFLHEGLGSVSMWRDFPERLCEATGRRGLVYSRPGYGRSTPRPHGERWGVDFMHEQALDVLPALLEALGVDIPIILFGHSDGGSIALIHAARRPERVVAVIALAPHIMVEGVSVRSIRETREAYIAGGLRPRLARHHADADSAFWGWNDIWLDPAFRDWSIEALLPAIRCPVLAIQGVDDPYGTLAQVRGIAARVPGTTLVELPACGHSPHRDQPRRVIEAVQAFIASRTIVAPA